MIFATAVVVSVCTFLLQWGGCCIQHTDHTGTHVRVQVGWGYGFDMHRGRHMLEEARRQRHEARQQALVANQPKGLLPHVLNNLSSFTIKNKDEPSSDDLDCTICQEDLCQEKVSSLPCGHMFHKKCIRTWLRRKATCPTCRLGLTEEMLRHKQHPAVAVNVPAAGDIESGTIVHTDGLNIASDLVPTILAVPAAQHHMSGRLLDCYQPPDEQVQCRLDLEGSVLQDSTQQRPP